MKKRDNVDAMNGPPDPIVRVMLAAVEHHQNGLFDEAERGYQQVLLKQPRNPDALHLLGLVEHQREHFDQAVHLIEKAIRVKPNEALFHTNLGQVYRMMERLDEADRCHRRALELDPKMPEAHSHLAAVLRAKRRLDEAEKTARHALTLNPNLLSAYVNLGAVLKDRGLPQEALQCFERALQLGPPRFEVLNNAGDALRSVGRYDEARLFLEEAIRQRPDNPLTHWNLSLVYLTTGDLPRGLVEYEWRLKQTDMAFNRFDQPRWNGEDLNGRTILLHAEQGFGDTIQFIRYAPLVASRGARVIVQCQPQLLRLLKSMPGIAQVTAKGEALPDFDLQAPIMSLPYIFSTTLDTIPSKTPYVQADPELVARSRALIPANPGTMNVGLVWAGNPTHVNDRNRSIPFSDLAPIGNIPGVNWFSLQVSIGPVPDRIGNAGLADLMTNVTDFADSAALMSQLDLIISVDTAPAHLAGALGKSVWMLLPTVPDWRWLLEREDSPWYPTMRLFRQRTPGNWTDVIARITELLGRKT